jgi:hypothetical protein
MARQQQMRGKIPLQVSSGMLGKGAPASVLRITKQPEGTSRLPEIPYLERSLRSSV